MMRMTALQQLLGVFLLLLLSCLRAATATTAATAVLPPLPEMTRDECLGISRTRTIVVANDENARGKCQSSNGGYQDVQPPIGIIVGGEELCCPLLLEVPPAGSSIELPFFTTEQCFSMKGQVVGDIGNGAIFEPDYVCESSGKKPFGIIATIPLNHDGAPVAVAVEGSVCCGPPIRGGGQGGNDEPPTMSRDECTQLGGLIIYDRGDGSSRRPDYRCDSNGLGILGLVVATRPDEPLSFEGEVCCGAATATAVEPILVESPSSSSSSSSLQEFTRQECLENSGVIVGDIGDGATRRDDYVCASSGEPILAIIVPAVDGEEPIAKDGEVCCGGPMVVNRQECTMELGGIVVHDVGDGSSRRPQYRCDSNGKPILAIIVPAVGEPISKEEEVCCGAAEPVIVTRQECTDHLDGFIVQDIGDGSSRRPGYLCKSSGEPILAIVVPTKGEPIGREGEVCCGAATGTALSFPAVTRDECELEYDGVVIGDIGDGMTLRDDYRCITNGEPIIGVIMPSSTSDENIAIEGEVCCGLADSEDEVDERCNWFCQCSKSVNGWFRHHFGSD
jgi:hypothetical protein